MAVCLVTGGAGFVGSHLTQALVKRGHQVRVLDNLSTGAAKNLTGLIDQIEIHQADLLDANAVSAALQGVEWVFHQAALASVPRSVAEPLETHAACVTATVQLLHLAVKAGVKRVVYAASSSAYGNQATPVKRETDLPAPLSPYAAAKLAAEYYCASFYHSYGLETVALRYFNVFGPRQDPSGPYAAVIPIFIKRLLEAKSPIIYGDGLQTRDFTFVENVVEANLLAATSTGAVGRVMNIGNGQSTSLVELLASINRALGTNIAAEFQPERTGDVRDSLADISLARELLGYVPRVDLEQGLACTIAYYKNA